MTLSTATSTSLLDSSRSFHISREVRTVSTSVTTAKTPSANLLSADVSVETQVRDASSRESFSFYKKEIERNVVSRSVSYSQEKVLGSVLQVEGKSVHCEFAVNGDMVSVTLPIDLFPTTPSYGAPIALEMVEDGGYRTPSVTMRAPRTNIELESSLAEIYALAAEF